MIKVASIITCVNVRMGLMLGTFRLMTLELLDPVKTIALLLENYATKFDDFSCWLSGAGCSKNLTTSLVNVSLNFQT